MVRFQTGPSTSLALPSMPLDKWLYQPVKDFIKNDVDDHVCSRINRKCQENCSARSVLALHARTNSLARSLTHSLTWTTTLMAWVLVCLIGWLGILTSSVISTFLCTYLCFSSLTHGVTHIRTRLSSVGFAC